MPKLVHFAACLFAVAVMLSTTSCSNNPPPPAKAYMSEFSDVMARLTQVAKEQSVNDITISIGDTTEEPDGKRVVKARRVTPQSTTEYTMRFHKPKESWLCERADSEETKNTGGTGNGHIEGSSIGIEGLIGWLKW